jgi:hypothetical protein
MKLSVKIESVDALRCALAIKPSHGFHDHGLIIGVKNQEVYATDGFCAVLMPADILVEDYDEQEYRSLRTKDVKIPKGAKSLEFDIMDWRKSEDWVPLRDQGGTPCGFVAPAPATASKPPSIRNTIQPDYELLPFAPAIGYNPATAMQVLKASVELKKTNYRCDPIRFNGAVAYLWRFESGGEFVLVGLRDDKGFGDFWRTLDKLK